MRWNFFRARSPVVITRKVYKEKVRTPTDKEFYDLLNFGLWK